MKTAVEWLAKELESYGDPQICRITWEDFDSLVNQAKAMEKEHMEKMYKHAMLALVDGYGHKEKNKRVKEMKKSDEKKLRSAIDDVFWMAVRYAHGRHTYAPGMVRDAFAKIKSVFPDFELKHDITIEPPMEEELGFMAFRGDYLDDLFKAKND